MTTFDDILCKRLGIEISVSPPNWYTVQSNGHIVWSGRACCWLQALSIAMDGVLIEGGIMEQQKKLDKGDGI